MDRPGLGLLTPIVTLAPGGHARWEREGTIADIARIARAAEELGYDHLTCSEHVAIPTAAVPTRGSRYWDPLATFGYLAAQTTRIRFATDVLVLGYHHPLDIAKRYGTLDQISGGRLVLGLGVGSLEEEFALLDVPFADRGARADDALRALRASFPGATPRQATPRYDGQFYSYEGMVVDPTWAQDRVPVWIGGRTRRSLRRAVELGDGWCPFGLSAADVASMLEGVALPPGFEVVIQNQRPIDPLGAPDETRGAVDELHKAGATMLSLRFVHHSLEHYLEQLAGLVELVG